MRRGEQFFGIDLRSLTVLRIGLAALLLADLVYRAQDFRAHYTDQGVLPRTLYLDVFSNIEAVWSFHLILGSPTYTALLFFASGVAALALQDSSDESTTERGIRGAMAANKLVFRLLLIWAVIIAAMTLYGLTR